MRAYDIIEKKKLGLVLSKEEIKFFIDGYSSGKIPDYQASALLMAIYFNGMNSNELAQLTIAMEYSGDVEDLSDIAGVKVDKHSTGGVGDKTTLIIVPCVAACGVKVAKMSGRGLGFTGGTVDKLEAIPGYRTDLSKEEFHRIVNQIGASVIGQSGELAPADKKLYALRDVTATVDSIPLIAASIMSKKLAAGSDKILLDVTTGSGAFIPEYQKSVELARTMVAIGNKAGKETLAVITNMDVPLGQAIGNNVEIKEAIRTLQGDGPEDVVEVCLELAARMIVLARNITFEQAKDEVREVISSGKALAVLKQMVEAQGGDSRYIDNPDLFERAKVVGELKASESGYIQHMDTKLWGKMCGVLGAGREKKEDNIDFCAGIYVKKKTGDYVEKGERIAKLFTNDEKKLELALDGLSKAYSVGETKPRPQKLVLATIYK